MRLHSPSLSPLSKRTRFRYLGVSLSPLHPQIKYHRVIYYSVAITLLLFATLPTIPAFARLIAAEFEPRSMAFYGATPSSAPCLPECQEHRQIVPECNVLAVEWRRYQGRRSFGGPTIPSMSARRKSERKFPRLSLPESGMPTGERNA
jgi:hypothetical protein